MKKYYYTNQNQQPTGPVSFAELQQLAAAGVIKSDTAIVGEGSKEPTTWGGLAASEAPKTDVNALAAERMLSSMKELPVGDALFGALLVFFSFWTTPATVLRRSILNLAEWGRNRALPTSESELPVLTYSTIVGRPTAHLLWFACFWLGGFYWFIAGGGSYYGGFNIVSAILSLLGSWAVAYFGQYIVGFLYESLSIMIRVANDVSKLAKR
ncbi:MAG: DUF4339 domain-containing protein [Opitutaceae bacterium]|nr:DUF4339 domain-containing protein [Opitutaceae bacterium]